MPTIRYAGFWRRAVARGLDVSLLFVLSWILLLVILGAVFWGQRLMGLKVQVPASVTQQILLWIAYVILAAPYYMVGHFRWGTTVGKRLLSVYVVRADVPDQGITLPQSVARWFGYLISSLVLGLGYVMAAFHPRKQALHDLIAGTVCRVIRVSAGEPLPRVAARTRAHP